MAHMLFCFSDILFQEIIANVMKIHVLKENYREKNQRKYAQGRAPVSVMHHSRLPVNVKRVSVSPLNYSKITKLNASTWYTDFLMKYVNM